VSVGARTLTVEAIRWTKEGRHADHQMPTSPKNLVPRVAERPVARRRTEPLMRALATDAPDPAPVERELPGRPARRRTRERLTKDDVRHLLELATGVEPAAALVAALHEASRGDAGPAVALLRELLTAGRGRVSPEEHVFRREGEYWTIAYEGQVIRLHDTKGLRYLARLLRQPGHPVPVMEFAEHGTGAADHASIERARLAVTKAIRIALARIAAAHPGLGRHLTATVRRGYSCVYLPDPRAPIAWTE
jgi:hypothetical protein